MYSRNQLPNEQKNPMELMSSFLSLFQQQQQPNNTEQNNQNHLNDQNNQFNGQNHHYGQNRHYNGPNQYIGQNRRYNGPNQYNDQDRHYNGPNQYNDQNRHYNGPNQYNGQNRRYNGPNQYNNQNRRYNGQNQYNGQNRRYNGPNQYNDQNRRYNGPKQYNGQNSHYNNDKQQQQFKEPQNQKPQNDSSNQFQQFINNFFSFLSNQATTPNPAAPNQAASNQTNSNQAASNYSTNLFKTLSDYFQNEFSIFQAARDLKNPINKKTPIFRRIQQQLPNTQLPLLDQYQQNTDKLTIKLVYAHNRHSYWQYQTKKTELAHKIIAITQQMEINSKQLNQITLNSYTAALQNENNRRHYKEIVEQMDNEKKFLIHELYDIINMQIDPTELPYNHPTYQNLFQSEDSTPTYSSTPVSSDSFSSVCSQLTNNNHHNNNNNDNEVDTHNNTNEPNQHQSHNIDIDVTDTEIVNNNINTDTTSDKSRKRTQKKCEEKKKVSKKTRNKSSSPNYHLRDLATRINLNQQSKQTNLLSTATELNTPTCHAGPSSSSSYPPLITTPNQLQKNIITYSFDKLDVTTHHAPNKNTYTTELNLSMAKNVVKEHVIDFIRTHLPTQPTIQTLITFSIVNNAAHKSTSSLSTSFTYFPECITPPSTHMNCIFSLKTCLKIHSKLEWPFIYKDGFIELLFTDEETISKFNWDKIMSIMKKFTQHIYLFSTYPHLHLSLTNKLSALFNRQLHNVTSFLH